MQSILINPLAFKEWAVIVSALEKGRQAFLLRADSMLTKGGASDFSGKTFCFFPTYTHPNLEDLKPEVHDEARHMESTMPETGTVRVASFAQAVAKWKVDHPEQLNALRDDHIWSDLLIEERFRRYEGEPLWLILLRTYRLANAVVVEMRPEYSGCKTWTTLKAYIPTEGVQEVLDEGRLKSLRDKIRNVLDGQDGSTR